jgi:hypothetical protein
MIWRRSSRLLACGETELPLTPCRPLFFHHISKTAGTSLTRAIRRAAGRRAMISQGGNLPLDFIERVIAAGLHPDNVIHGHPGHGVAAALRGRADIVTLLREPADQIISNFLFIRTDPNNPDSAPARALGFRGFVTAYPYYAMFQTASLYVGLKRRPLGSCAEITWTLPEIHRFLTEMQLVGTVPRAREFLIDLARLRGWRKLPTLSHLKRTRAKPHEREALREQLVELQSNPELAPLFAIERRTYEFARSLESERLSNKEYPSPRWGEDDAAHLRRA